MARIVYGISGEGRGHGTRSKPVIEHLIKEGHEVRIVTSRAAYDYLSGFFDDITNIIGLEFAFGKQKFDPLKTIQVNMKKSFLKGNETFNKLTTLFKDFKPDITITDFEIFTNIISGLKGTPVISISNQHLISQCNIEYPRSWYKDYLSSVVVIKNMYSFAKHYFITHFHSLEMKKRFKEKSDLVGPILREEIQASKPKKGDHILVYVTTEKSQEVLPLLQKIDENFVAYGFGRKGMIDNIDFKETGTEEFLEDLSSAKAIFTNGGYILMTEALFFGKPIFSIPIQDYFEQMLNGYYLEKCGYGLYEIKPTKQRIEMFLEGLDYFRKNISRKKANFNGNKKFFKLLDAKVEEII